MKKLIALLIVAPPLLFAALFACILYRGPRMTVQHHFREFQVVTPAPAATNADAVEILMVPF